MEPLASSDLCTVKKNLVSAVTFTITKQARRPIEHCAMCGLDCIMKIRECKPGSLKLKEVKLWLSKKA